MITGSYIYRGAVLPVAVVQPTLLQIGTYPWGKLWFDAMVWGSIGAQQAADGPVETRPIVRLEGPDDAALISSILANFARGVYHGEDHGEDDAAWADELITSAHDAMDDMLLSMPEFAGWTKV